jgi:transketolase
MIIDNNHLQKMGSLMDIMGFDSWVGRLESFGWQVRLADGHDVDDLRQKLTENWETGKPRALIAETVKGKGVSIMEGVPGWHWKMPNKKELKIVIQELDITQEELGRCRRPI